METSEDISIFLKLGSLYQEELWKTLHLDTASQN